MMYYSSVCMTLLITHIEALWPEHTKQDGGGQLCRMKRADGEPAIRSSHSLTPTVLFFFTFLFIYFIFFYLFFFPRRGCCGLAVPPLCRRCTIAVPCEHVLNRVR